MAKELTELDKQLREIAALNWSQFVQLIGEDAVLAAKICLLRQAGKSYGAISQKLNVTQRQAEYGCGKCDPKS